MTDKPKFVPVTDPAMQEELLRDPSNLGVPYAYKPNGHLWVEEQEFEAWRAGREEVR